VLGGSGVALLSASVEDAAGAGVPLDVEDGGGSELSKSGGKMGAESGASGLPAALFVFS